MKTEPVEFSVRIDSPEIALALAQFLKRVGHSDCERRADPTIKDEPYRMLIGLECVRRGLAEVGYSPR
jgi:hypothetical protein